MDGIIAQKPLYHAFQLGNSQLPPPATGLFQIYNCDLFSVSALAFACLDAFIPKYLHKFFLKDNSPGHTRCAAKPVYIKL